MNIKKVRQREAREQTLGIALDKFGDIIPATVVRDKVAADYIVDWHCIDCGVNTHPGCSDQEDQVTFDDRTEVYAVKDAIWKKAGMTSWWGGCLCIGCIEKRLGRQLTPKDFSRHDAEAWAYLPCTQRLLHRRMGWIT
jgi:hypothetical protein